MMRVLVACEFSQVVTKAFRERGHEAYSCDLLPTEGNPKWHIQGDVIDVLNNGWDMLIAHPPCTYLTVTGNKWFKTEYKDRFPDRTEQRQSAINFFMLFAFAPIDKICIENPVGVMSTIWRKPDQYIHPYYFGEPHSKKTGLWLNNLPKLTPTNVVEPQFYIYKDGRRDPLWHVDTMKLSATERTKARSKTFQGIADAMAEQWGNEVESDIDIEL